MLYDGVTNNHILIPMPVYQSMSFFSFVHSLSSPPLIQISLTFSHFLKPFAQLCQHLCNILFNQHMKLCSRRLFFLLLIDPFRRYFNRSMMHSARELQSVSDHLLLTFVTFQWSFLTIIFCLFSYSSSSFSSSSSHLLSSPPLYYHNFINNTIVVLLILLLLLLLLLLLRLLLLSTDLAQLTQQQTQAQNPMLQHLAANMQALPSAISPVVQSTLQQELQSLCQQWGHPAH